MREKNAHDIFFRNKGKWEQVKKEMKQFQMELNYLQAQRGNLWKAVRDNVLTRAEAAQLIRRELTLLYSILQYEQYRDFQEYDSYQKKHPREKPNQNAIRKDLIWLRRAEIKIRRILTTSSAFEKYVDEMIRPPRSTR